MRVKYKFLIVDVFYLFGDVFITPNQQQPTRTPRHGPI